MYVIHGVNTGLYPPGIIPFEGKMLRNGFRDSSVNSLTFILCCVLECHGNGTSAQTNVHDFSQFIPVVWGGDDNLVD